MAIQCRTNTKHKQILDFRHHWSFIGVTLWSIMIMNTYLNYKHIECNYIFLNREAWGSKCHYTRSYPFGTMAHDSWVSLNSGFSTMIEASIHGRQRVPCFEIQEHKGCKVNRLWCRLQKEVGVISLFKQECLQTVAWSRYWCPPTTLSEAPRKDPCPADVSNRWADPIRCSTLGEIIRLWTWSAETN